MSHKFDNVTKELMKAVQLILSIWTLAGPLMEGRIAWNPRPIGLNIGLEEGRGCGGLFS